MEIRDLWVGGELFGVHWQRERNQQGSSVVVSSRKAEGPLVARVRLMGG